MIKAFLLAKVLRIISLIYGFFLSLRNFLYEAGIFKSKILEAKVISIGNITLGGTGKTLAVIALAKKLQEEGRRVAVLLRGYKGRYEGRGGIVCDGSSILLNPKEAGDEAYLLAERLSKVPILVGKNRIKSGKIAIDKLGAEILILDDGFQHRRLARDLDIVLINAINPFGNGRLFPSGILREKISALGRADAFLLTKADQATDDSKIRDKLLKINSKALIIESIHKPVSFLDKEGKEYPLTIIKDRSVLAFSGIGHPESFEKMLKDLGAREMISLRYPDHHLYCQRDIRKIKEKAKKVELLISTEKDRVRLPLSLFDSIFFLRIELQLAKNDWQKLIPHKGTRCPL